MKDLDFFEFLAKNSEQYIILSIIFCGILFFSVRKVAYSGLFDPIHLFWSFTFGTTYATVTLLFFSDYIKISMMIFIFSFAAIFILTLNYFDGRRYVFFHKFFENSLLPGANQRVNILLLMGLYVLLCFVIVSNVGFSIFSEINRFESSRGSGQFIRLAKAVGPFLMCYIFISAISISQINRIKSILGIFIVLMLMIFSAALFGAKADFLLYIYSMLLAFSLFSPKTKIPFKYSVIIFGISVAVGVAVLFLNMVYQGSPGDEGFSFSENGFIINKIIMRVIANADQVYLSLPYGVIDNLEKDSIFIRMIIPYVGNSNINYFLGYDASSFDLGRQAILYHYPLMDYAGGPTSHFDLFSYKYIGVYFGWLFSFFVGTFLAFLKGFFKGCQNNIYKSSLFAAIWTSSLAILLEPSVGIAYFIDMVIVFSIINILGKIIIYGKIIVR